MKDQREPPIPLDLLTWLGRLYPEVEVTPTKTHAEVAFAGGQRSVVRFLQSRYQDQQDESLGRSMTDPLE